MFTKLGKKIMQDAARTEYVPKASKSLLFEQDDDSFQRYTGGSRSLCETGDDVYYHGGHDHDHDDGLTDD